MDLSCWDFSDCQCDALCLVWLNPADVMMGCTVRPPQETLRTLSVVKVDSWTFGELDIARIWSTLPFLFSPLFLSLTCLDVFFWSKCLPAPLHRGRWWPASYTCSLPHSWLSHLQGLDFLTVFHLFIKFTELLSSLGSDIGFSMFTLRENLERFLKEVEVGMP